MKLSMFFVKMALMLLIASPTGVWAETRIRCASTTSTQNSGLFDYLLPLFAQKTGIKVDVVAVGTGAALQLGRRGDVDVVLVHARDQELAAVAEGFFVDRHEVMYNDFVIIGPAEDPAQLAGLKSAAAAFRSLAERSAVFVSRGDKSGTHTKELAVWKEAGFDPKGQQWYLEVGQGMAKTQRIAREKRAYTLTDRGTWLGSREDDKAGQKVVIEGDPLLFNQYGLMAVNPQKHPQAKYPEALKFIQWLVSPEGQQAIGAFRDKHGNPLFIPNAH